MAASQRGIIGRPSRHSVDDTVERLTQLLSSNGIALFALIDHGAEAAKVGLTMRPTKLVIFGNPIAGTPLMVASPSLAIDLPLKILVWEDAEGSVWVSFNDPAYLIDRHGLPPALLPNIAGVEKLAAHAAE